MPHLLGLELLHDHGWYHRDINPCNIFIEADGMTRIGDMEYAISTKDRTETHAIRTVSFYCATPMPNSRTVHRRALTTWLLR